MVCMMFIAHTISTYSQSFKMGRPVAYISLNTLANANVTRPWQIYADFAQHLIDLAPPLYATEPFGLELDAAVYAFDASTIDLCLSVFAWAPFRSAKAAIKLHTLLDLRGNIPPASFTSPTARRTRSICWTIWCSNLGRFT